MGTSEKVPIFAQIVPRKGITVPSRALPMRVRLALYGFVYSLKSIENSIDFAAKQQVWQRMIFQIIRPMLIAMNIWQNSLAVLLRRKAARRKAFWLFAIL